VRRHLFPANPRSDFPGILSCLASLLQFSPTRHIWSFDSSPELPHTLFSEIKNNHSFQNMLVDRFEPAITEALASPPSAIAGHDEKGKRKVDGVENPFAWVSPFLLSLVEPEQERANSSSSDTGFPEGLAQAASFCLQDLQHERFAAELRAAAAQAIFEVRVVSVNYEAQCSLIMLHRRF